MKRDKLRGPYGCSVEATLDVIGGKWKGVLVFHLLFKTLRFNELRRLVPGVTQRILTLQLRELEADGVIHREVYAEIPPRVEYSLTEFGRTLQPIILLMRTWGDDYQQRVLERRANAANNIEEGSDEEQGVLIGEGVAS